VLYSIIRIHGNHILGHPVHEELPTLDNVVGNHAPHVLDCVEGAKAVLAVDAEDFEAGLLVLGLAPRPTLALELAHCGPMLMSEIFL
jgi:hypothetical protein